MTVVWQVASTTRYLKILISVPFAYLKVFDGDGQSSVHPVAHGCETSLVANGPDVDMVVLKEIR